MRTNYSGNKRKKEEARRKKQEEKRNKRLAKSKAMTDQELGVDAQSQENEAPPEGMIPPDENSQNTY